MNRTKTRRTLTALLLLLGLGTSGCVNGTVSDAARASLTSFLTTLASTAISQAVNSK